MPEKATMEAAKEDLREGKSSSTAAGEFVREEMDHIREGKHGASSTKQAIAIGLSKARRAGIPLGQPSAETTSAATRHKAAQDTERGKTDPATGEEGQTKRGRAREKAMKRDPHHGDPFDRMLVAQAINHSLALLTGDAEIPKYPVKTLW